MIEGFSRRNGQRKGVTRIGVVITDGNSTNPYRTKDQAQAVKNKGISMFAIGM